MTKKITIDWEAQENVEWHDYKPKKQTDKRRSLLITTDNFLPRWDGISRFLSEIVPRLKHSYDITIVAPDYGAVKMEGVRIVQIPLQKKTFGDYTPSSFQYRTIKRLVRQSDLVLNQALGPIGMCSILAANRLHRPIASYIHNVEWELFPKALAHPLFRGPIVGCAKSFVRFFYNRCTTLILPSENIAEQYSWQRIRTRKHIAHLGVDTTKFKPGEKDKAREKLGLPKDTFIIGFHGRIAYEKNLLTLARAFARVDIPDKMLLIVGEGVPELRERLKKLRDVRLAGIQDNVVPWLQSMDIYAQPSFTETTSLAVLEAMACSLPVVSSKVGFIKHYIIDDHNGMFFENTSTYPLIRKLQKLYENEKLREKLGANARKTIEKSFQWDQTAQRITDALDSI